MSDERRVVVTGLGMVSPLGTGWRTAWDNALAGTSTAGEITRFDASEHACRIACEVRGFEAVLTALAIREGKVPPTINLENLDESCAGVDHVLGEAREAPVRLALSNSFGFGGHNAVLAFAAMEDA